MTRISGSFTFDSELDSFGSTGCRGNEMGKAQLKIRELIEGNLKTKIDKVWQIGREEYQSFQESNDSSNVDSG